MNPLHFFRTFFQSFYSASLYRDVALRRGGIGFGYLFALCILVSAIYLTQAFLLFKTLNREENFEEQAYYSLRDMADQLPPMHMKDHRLSVHAPQPYFIYLHTMDHKKPEELLAVFDATGATTSLADSKASILITDREFYAKRRDRTEVRDFREIPDFYFDKSSARMWLEKGIEWYQSHKVWLLLWLGAMTLVMMALGLFLYRLIQALIYGAIGMIFASILKLNILYQTSVRLACVAVTPAVILALVPGLMLSGWIYLIVGLGYLLFGMASTKELSEAQKPTNP
jgi:hypothetical protein